MEECCKTCMYRKSLVLWNLDGKDMPNYDNLSDCCVVMILGKDEKLTCGDNFVHQINNPEEENCENWKACQEYRKINNEVCAFMTTYWNAQTDACDDCRECDYFLHEYWNCQGDVEPCIEFHPKPGSNKKLVSIEITEDDNESGICL